MTRINCVPVEELTTQHLVAEYRELPRVFALVRNSIYRKEPMGFKSPKEYTMGTGHVRFFYDKLEWLNNRQKELINEMLNRGYSPNYLNEPRYKWGNAIPEKYWNNWTPTEEALKINRQRISDRLNRT